MKKNSVKKIVILASLILFAVSCNDPYSNLGNGSGNGYGDGSLHPGGGGWNPSNPGYLKKIINYKDLSKAIGFYDFDGSSNTRQIRNDLTGGALTGMVQFAQSHTIDPKGNAANFLPMLVAERSALLLFTPTSDIAASVKSVTVEVYANGEYKGALSMNEPDFIPRSDSTQPTKQEVLYSRKAWTAELAWNWVGQGMEIRFIGNDGKQGLLMASDIEVGPPSEAVFAFIRLGMLTGFRTWGSGYMMDAPGRAMADYFQTIPVAKAINVTYENRSIDRLIVYDGTLYDLKSPDPLLRVSKTTADAYSGDMRAAVAKSQVSVGINMANYGVPSNNMGQGYGHYFYIMTTHLAQGLYKNGVQAHGYSGGNGIGTLNDTTGNEFSHEVGHSYGFGHFQQPSGKPEWWQGGHADSGWGYSSYKKRMRSNLWWGSNGSQGNTPNNHFKRLYNYNRDTMSGGWNESTISVYTHLTGYSAMRGQAFFTGKPVLSETSSTGYLKWNANTKKMEEFTQASQNKYKPLKPYKIGVPVITILGGYYPDDFETNPRARAAMLPYFRGNWGNVFKHEEPNSWGAKACWLEIDFLNGEKDRIKVAEFRHDTTQGSPNQFHVNIEEARNPISAKLYCQNAGSANAVLLDSQPIPTNMPPMRPPVIIGKEHGYTQAIQEEIAILEKKLEKYKDDETPILNSTESETLVWLFDNISEMNDVSQAVATKYLNSLSQGKTIEKFIDNNYDALKKGDVQANALLAQIYTKSGFGEITAPFNKNGVFQVQNQCVTLVENGSNLFDLKFANCVAGNKNQAWFLDSLNRVRSSKQPRMCVQGIDANYTPLVIKTCENIAVQTWTLEAVSNDKYLMKLNANTGRCLVRQTNGNKIVTWACDKESDTQLWSLPPKDTRQSLVFLSNEDYDIVYNLFKN